MGLDMHAGYLHPKPERPDNVVDIKDDIGDRMEAPYYWRKHARLQQHMTYLWHKKNGGEEYGFNGGDVLILTKEDILELKRLVETDDLPFCEGGFFWGHQFQEESMREYKKQDLEFCETALEWIEQGKEVWYESSW
tara:strand:- start:33 stop:440 length:408 start_codon:yes stop_codon:yes gene_type:complete